MFGAITFSLASEKGADLPPLELTLRHLADCPELVETIIHMIQPGQQGLATQARERSYLRGKRSSSSRCLLQFASVYLNETEKLDQGA